MAALPSTALPVETEAVNVTLDVITALEKVAPRYEYDSSGSAKELLFTGVHSVMDMLRSVTNPNPCCSLIVLTPPVIMTLSVVEIRMDWGEDRKPSMSRTVTSWPMSFVLDRYTMDVSPEVNKRVCIGTRDVFEFIMAHDISLGHVSTGTP